MRLGPRATMYRKCPVRVVRSSAAGRHAVFGPSMRVCTWTGTPTSGLPPGAVSWPVSRTLLRIMDVVGNRRFGVALPHRYWSAAQWDAAIQSLPVRRDLWQVGGLRLYPGPADWVFGRDLHVVARLSPA